MVGRTRAAGRLDTSSTFTEYNRAIDGVHLTFEKGLPTTQPTMQAHNGQNLPRSTP